MGFSHEKFGFHSYRILMIEFLAIILFLFPSLAWSDEPHVSQFSEAHSLSLREFCDIYRSADERRYSDSGRLMFTKCDKVSPFHAVGKLVPEGENGENYQKLEYTSQSETDWPFADVSIRSIEKDWNFKDISFVLDGTIFDLSEYVLGYQKGFDQIELGYSGSTILIRLQETSIHQVAITQNYCEDGSVDYSVSEVFSWYPPFLEDSYHKTIFKTPTCI